MSQRPRSQSALLPQTSSRPLTPTLKDDDDDDDEGANSDDLDVELNHQGDNNVRVPSNDDDGPWKNKKKEDERKSSVSFDDVVNKHAHHHSPQEHGHRSRKYKQLKSCSDLVTMLEYVSFTE